MRRIAVIYACLALLIAMPAHAQSPDSDPLFAKAVWSQGKEHLDAGRPRQAIDLLSPALKQNPDSGPLARLLAAAYMADGNDFWAQKVLMDHGARTRDCDTLSMLAWLYLKNAELDQAEGILLPPPGGDGGQCLNDPGPSGTRRHLLCCLLHLFAERPEEALGHLQTAYRANNLYPEDRKLLDWLSERLDKGYIDPISLRMDQSIGWNSNALLASAAEVRTADQVESWLVQNEHEIRFVPPFSRIVRPVMEYNGRARVFLDGEASEVGFYQIAGRAGLLLGDGTPRFGLYYANEDLLYFGEDRYQEKPPRWFYEAHRGEFEYEILPRLLFFGGSGKRFYRERARTRNEFDAGLAGSIPLYRTISLTLIGTGRSYDAQIRGYDAMGTSELLVLTIPYYQDGTIRIGGTFSYDQYPGSAGYYQQDEDRLDMQYRLIPAVWSPSIAGFRAGLTYEYTDRSSTVEAYDYDVHEVLFHLAWRGGFDPWMPKSVVPARHVPIDYGLGRHGGYEERMQDLLRQEDAAQRSSSCVD